MKTIRLIFKDTKNIVTLSFDEIAHDCNNNPTELEIMRALKEMEKDSEIAILPVLKNY